MRDLTNELLEKYENAFLSCKKNIVAMNAASLNGIEKAATNIEGYNTNTHNFSIEIDAGDITNQKHSGRCWMFAALNMIRIEIMKNLNLKTMEISESYTMFYDKLEKANFFLNSIIDTVDEPLDGRTVAFLLKDPMQDGGQYDMIKFLIQKYGIVPKEAMQEVANTENTVSLDRIVDKKLKEFARDLRNAHDEGKSVEELYQMEEEMMATIYKMVAISVGVPPKKFTFEARDKDNKFVRISNITPQEFFEKYAKINLDDYVSVINAPTKDKPYYKSYTVKFLGNVYGKNVKYVNLPIEVLKRLAVAQMQDGDSVWFGSDVLQYSDRQKGILDTDLKAYDKLFGTEFNLNKAERLDYAESVMNHAMLLTGVNLDDEGKPNRYRVENSWGKDVGKDGFFTMSDKWFDEYVYQVVVNKKYLTQEELDAWNQEPVVLEPWDPMGSLAYMK